MTKAVLKDKKEFLKNEGIIRNCKEVDGEFYYLLEIKEIGYFARKWYHEDQIEIL